MEQKGAVSNQQINHTIPPTALYVRVSTDAQFEEGYSIDAQKKKLVQWCVMKDIADYEFYIDGGFSGSNIDRPEMKRLIDNIKQDRIRTVVVYKLDRLSRSQKDTIFLLEDVFIPHNANFISLNENFDTTTPYGKAMIGILSVFAQLERENIRDRTRMGMYERVKSGYWMGGGRVPFGYDYDKNKGVLVPNADAEKIKQIFDLYLQGFSTTKIASMFHFKGDKQVTDILDRETYLGLIRYNGELIRGLHQPLIERDIFDRVKAHRVERSQKNAVTSAYLLTGLIVCGKCGAKFRYQKWGKDTVKVYCYSQQSSKPRLIRDPNCRNAKLDAFELERLVVDDLFRISDELSAYSAHKSASANPTSALDVLRNQAELVTGKLKRLYELYATDGNPILLETIEEQKAEHAKLSGMIADEEKLHTVSKQILQRKQRVKNLRNTWKNMNTREQQQIIRLMIEKIVVDDENIDIVYRV